MRYFIWFFFFAAPLLLFSQQPYWQQQVDYKIEVTLNDQLHELDGYVTIDYLNHSPDTLSYIYFHLWPNAYKDNTTPFAGQLLENGDTRFWFSKPWQRGYMDSINFKVNGQPCKWQFEPGSVEICRLILSEPLPAAGRIVISTPFHVKLPENFSRMGHQGQSYQVSQWYPKPAVYDKQGWHPMPYLDQGEFYSEFGSFDVSITLPDNYVVGATGDLQDSTEIAWMNEKAEAAKRKGNFVNKGDITFPPSSGEMKTIRFKQNKVHDFAWFADKRFNVLKGEVDLPYSGRKVTTWTLFTNAQGKYWAKAPQYLHDAIFYYSRWLGDYAYNQVTAVSGALGAASGMEYPNVTVIGVVANDFTLDRVITHEAGHNWFYGMLATNEREHAWMDEGINSYYENRYINRKYPGRKLAHDVPKGIAAMLDISHYPQKYMYDLQYQFVARENYDQPAATRADLLTNINESAIIYGKTGLAFAYLEAYLGTARFDTIMQTYFAQWSMRHPQPEDLRNVFESATGKDLSWFFNDLVGTSRKIDYKIQRVEKSKSDSTLRVYLKNVNAISSPVLVSLLRKDSAIYDEWIEGFSGTKEVVFPALEADKVKIDPPLLMPEINRKNNTYKLNRLAHKFEKLKLQFEVSVENQERTQILYSPYLAWNNYDKAQVGIALYNPFIPARRFSYLLVPAFGTGSKQFIGFGTVDYKFYPQRLQRIMLGVSGKRFSYLLFPQNLVYSKIEPHLELEFKKKNARNPFMQTFYFRSAIIWQGWINPVTEVAKETTHYFINEAKYKLERNSTLHPFAVQVVAQQGAQFMNLAAEGNFRISYRTRQDGLCLRVFAGGFLFNNKAGIHAPNPRFYLSNVTDATNPYWLQKDYMYDENFIDRNGRDPVFGRQVALTGGGFRSFTAFTGSTRKFLASLNVSSTIHKWVPVNPFASMAATVNDLGKAEMSAEMGLSLVIVRNMLEFHLPLVTTNNLKEQQKLNGITKWYQRITFTFKIELPRPIKALRQLI